MLRCHTVYIVAYPARVSCFMGTHSCYVKVKVEPLYVVAARSPGQEPRDCAGETVDTSTFILYSGFTFHPSFLTYHKLPPSVAESSIAVSAGVMQFTGENHRVFHGWIDCVRCIRVVQLQSCKKKTAKSPDIRRHISGQVGMYVLTLVGACGIPTQHRCKK